MRLLDVRQSNYYKLTFAFLCFIVVLNTFWVFQNSQQNRMPNYFTTRHFNEITAQFLSVDPAAPHFDDPKTLNPYLYCYNNPVKFIDPDGREGTLIIHSAEGENDLLSGLTVGNHAWIEYQQKGTVSPIFYSTWGNSIGGDIGLRINSPAELIMSIAGVGVSRSKYINNDQEKIMYQKINTYSKKGEKAWDPWNACSGFSSDVWNAATGEYLEDREFLGLLFSDPNILANSIRDANNNDLEKMKKGQ